MKEVFIEVGIKVIEFIVLFSIIIILYLSTENQSKNSSK